MKRKISYIALAFVAILTIVLLILNNKVSYVESCTAHIYSSIEQDNKKASYRIDLKITPNDKHNGYVKMMGTITTDKTYSINRVLHYTIEKTNENNLKTIINSVRKSPNDDIKDNNFTQYFKGLSLDRSSYIEINKIQPGRYLFSGSLGPYFICEVQDKNDLPIM